MEIRYTLRGQSRIPQLIQPRQISSAKSDTAGRMAQTRKQSRVKLVGPGLPQIVARVSNNFHFYSKIFYALLNLSISTVWMSSINYLLNYSLFLLSNELWWSFLQSNFSKTNVQFGNSSGKPVIYSIYYNQVLHRLQMDG